jgi:hypothetical protein
MPAVEPKRATHQTNPSWDQDPAALVAEIRRASLQMEQTLRAVESSVQQVWKTGRPGRG